MSYLLTQMLVYLLGALLLGLLLGWILWGRRGRNTAGMRTDVDRLRDENYSLRRDLDACGQARAALESRLAEAQSSRARALPAALEPAPAEPAPANLEDGPAQAKPAERPAAAALMSKPKKPSPRKVAPKAPAAPKPAAAAKIATGPAAAKPRKPKPIVQPDDLRRIIGIGPVNERLLHSEGVRSFAQIAGWTAADVKRIEDVLQFDGRIERERWIEQAKLLSAGEEQEFARRFPTAGSGKNT
jgi:predicted flap endonuclease-1-like 5' DNA nuclease